MNWIKLYIFCVLLSLTLFSYYLFKFTILTNRICIYLRDNYYEVFNSNRLSTVEEFADIFKARDAPFGEIFRRTRIIFSKDIILDDNLDTLQKRTKITFYLSLAFFVIFVLLGLSGKVIISWAGV